MDDAFEHAVRLVEALVFASAEPVAVSALERLVPMPHSAYEVLVALQERCRGRGVHLVAVGGGWQFRTAVDLAAELATMMEKPRRLPRVAMEVLAIIAQYQPVTRAEIEDIRGVALGQATVDIPPRSWADRTEGFPGGAGATDGVDHDAGVSRAFRVGLAPGRAGWWRPLDVSGDRRTGWGWVANGVVA
jgi:Segregation and condensation complex subunit ScpB